MAASEAKHVVGEARLLSFRDSRLVGSQERREAENHVATARECQQLDRKNDLILAALPMGITSAYITQL